AVCEAEARSEVGLLRVAQAAVVHELKADAVLLKQRGEGRRKGVVRIALVRPRFRNEVGGVHARRALDEIALRVVVFVDGGEVFPAQPEVQGQARSHLPVVLKVSGKVFAAGGGNKNARKRGRDGAPV